MTSFMTGYKYKGSKHYINKLDIDDENYFGKFYHIDAKK